MKKKDWFIVLVAIISPLLISGVLGDYAHNGSNVKRKPKIYQAKKPDPQKCVHPDGIELIRCREISKGLDDLKKINMLPALSFSQEV